MGDLIHVDFSKEKEESFECRDIFDMYCDCYFCKQAAKSRSIDLTSPWILRLFTVALIVILSLLIF